MRTKDEIVQKVKDLLYMIDTTCLGKQGTFSYEGVQLKHQRLADTHKAVAQATTQISLCVNSPTLSSLIREYYSAISLFDKTVKHHIEGTDATLENLDHNYVRLERPSAQQEAIFFELFEMIMWPHNADILETIVNQIYEAQQATPSQETSGSQGKKGYQPDDYYYTRASKAELEELNRITMSMAESCVMARNIDWSKF